MGRDPTGPHASDWAFTPLRGRDPCRADRLEAAGTGDELAMALVSALGAASDPDHFRVVFEPRCSGGEGWRAIIQFHVEVSIYDWFYNARTGYRAHYWRSPDHGNAFNRQISDGLHRVLSDRLPATVCGRIAIPDGSAGNVIMRDRGPITFSREEVLASLDPAAAKIWIAEHLYKCDGSDARLIWSSLFCDARWARAKMKIPAWTPDDASAECKGLWALEPFSETSWLDFKGGYVSQDGHVEQGKPPEVRARQIYERGWT